MASKARELANLGNAYSDGALSNRNLIINGAMQVAQRGGTNTSTGYGPLDRWTFNQTGLDNATYTISHNTSSDNPEFSNSLKFTTGTAESSVDADDRAYFDYRIEGQNLQHLNYGGNDAKAITLSFWVKSSITGTYASFIYQSDVSPNRSYLVNWTINTANTWEKKVITIAGDTAGNINNDTGDAFYLRWFLFAGSDWSDSSTPLHTWGSTVGRKEAPNQSAQVLLTSGSTWEITGVQLEVGDTATPFEHRSYGQELALCKRYFQKSYNDGTPVGTATSNGQVNWLTSQQWGVTSVPTGPITQGYVLASPELRATATVVPYSPVTGTANRFYLQSTSSDVTPNAWLQQAPSTVHIGYPQNAGGGGFSNTDTVKFHWTADAEL